MMEEWVKKCLGCYHCYTLKRDDREYRCKRADRGKSCRFYGQEEWERRNHRKSVGNAK